MNEIEMIITSRERDIGGFTVRRILPYATRRTVGPFIFFDHMGPADFAPGQGMDVRPHPHINLATVTYLFSGAIHHRDSLGSDQLIQPGDINWMTAGHGIVHSERTPKDLRKTGSHTNGIQCWVALPEEHEETSASFKHHPKKTLPEFVINDVKLKLLLGKAYGQTSPVQIHSDLFYLDAHLPKGATLTLPNDERECAVYVVTGSLKAGSEVVSPYHLMIPQKSSSMTIQALEETRIMLLGGKPVGERFMFWNFVSSSKERLEEVKKAWLKGPGQSSRFGKIPGDDSEFIPLPAEPATANPKGTIM